MNFLDHLTGFMETWPSYIAPRPILSRLNRFELSLPARYAADGILTVSDPLADRFADAGFPRDRILPIYYGVDSEAFPFDPDHGPPPDEAPVIVMHGSFDKHHLGDIAFKAAIEVHSRIQSARFRFVGAETPSLRSHIRRLRRAAPDIRIECAGFVPYDRIAEQLQSASVGIVPYEESEGTHCAFVAKAVEYLSVGLPTVATPLRGLMSYFPNKPMIRFSSFDGKEFGREITQALERSRPATNELRIKASERIRRELDWNSIGGRAMDFLERFEPGQDGVE